MEQTFRGFPLIFHEKYIEELDLRRQWQKATNECRNNLSLFCWV